MWLVHSLVEFNTHVFQPHTGSAGAPTDGHQYRVAFRRHFIFTVFCSDSVQPSLGFGWSPKLFDLGWYARADELDPMTLHVFTDLLCALLVETAQQDGTDHDLDLQTDAVQEAGTF